MESFRRNFLIDMVIIIDRFILKNNQITLSHCLPSYPQQVWDYHKQGLVFTALSKSTVCILCYVDSST